MKTFTLGTPKRETLVDITESVNRAIAGSGVDEGLCTVFVPHTTAGVTINENADPDVVADILAFLNKKIGPGFHFDHSEGNSDAHIKASLMGSSVTVPVTGGRLSLGTWQGIYFAEFDGPRTRKFQVVTLGEGGGK